MSLLAIILAQLKEALYENLYIGKNFDFRNFCLNSPNISYEFELMFMILICKKDFKNKNLNKFTSYNNSQGN